MDYEELDNLISALEKAVESTNPQKGYWSEIWSLVKEINSDFRASRYPTRSDKDQAWSRFQGLVANAKERSEENKARIEKNRLEWEQRQEKSKFAREEVQSHASTAMPLSEFEQSMADIIFFPAKLIAEVLLGLVGINTLSALEEKRQELLACNEALQEAWHVFNEQKGDMLPGDRNQAYESLQKAREQLNEAWSRWKETNASLWGQRHHEWEERQRAWEARQTERERNHYLFVEKVDANIAKLEGNLTRAEGALQKQEAHLEKI